MGEITLTIMLQRQVNIRHLGAGFGHLRGNNFQWKQSFLSLKEKKWYMSQDKDRYVSGQSGL